MKNFGAKEGLALSAAITLLVGCGSQSPNNSPSETETTLAADTIRDVQVVDYKFVEDGVAEVTLSEHDAARFVLRLSCVDAEDGSGTRLGQQQFADGAPVAGFYPTTETVGCEDDNKLTENDDLATIGGTLPVSYDGPGPVIHFLE